ncbi:hypothetical protein ACLEXA_22860 [Pseudescherichia vulneris]
MNEFINYIVQSTVKDVLITGYVDSEIPSSFHPMYDRIYFVISDDIFELYIDDGLINCNKLNVIDKWFEVDEDDKFSLMSVYSQLFKTEQELKVTLVDYQFTPFSAITIWYKDGSNERQICLDPNNFFGFTFL